MTEQEKEDDEDEKEFRTILSSHFGKYIELYGFSRHDAVIAIASMNVFKMADDVYQGANLKLTRQ